MWCYCPPSNADCGLKVTTYDDAKKDGGLQLTNSSSDGKTWEFSAPQSIKAGSAILCSLWGIPPVNVWVVGTQRFGGLFLQSQSLQDFPFDSQLAGFTVELSNNGASVFPVEDFTFVLGPTASDTIVPADGVGGWTVKSAQATVKQRVDKNLGATYSSSGYFISVGRIPTFFVSRFVTPLCLIIFFVIGSMLYSYTGGYQALRYGTPPTGFAMIVTFLFVAGQQVPVLTYSTRLDK